MSKRVFENLNLLIIASPELSTEELHRLQSICERNDVPYKVRDVAERITKEDFISSGHSHIISHTIIFDLYTFAQESLIPVTTPEYIFRTAETGKVQLVRQYSPDPTHVLKDVNICIGRLPTADKEAIYGGVRALGGSFAETLSGSITHLISIDPQEDCVIAVQSVKGFDIKVVHPLWIDHCLKLRKKLDETPYILGPIPVTEQEEQIRELDVLNQEGPYETRTPFLNGKQFYLAKDLELTGFARDIVTSLIEQSGGVVVDSLRGAKFYIGQFRDGEEYIAASRSKMYVGNLNWIYWMLEHQKWISPYKKLLHYPYVRGGLPEMSGYIISATNYTGDSRFYIKTLIEALGATFSMSLNPSCTHLISPRPTGKKYDAALKWNQKIVNHLWLEESYANWRLQPYNHPRYASTLSEKIKLTELVGETPLDIEVVKKFYEDGHSESNNTHVVEDSEDDGDQLPQLQDTSRSVLPSASDGTEDVGRGNLEAAEEESEKDATAVPDAEREAGQQPGQDEQTDEPTQDYPESEDAGRSATPEEKENQAPESQQKDLSSVPSQQKSTETELKTPLKKRNTDTAKSTPALRQLGDVSLASLLPLGGRKAKNKAAEKLHSDMEELNYFQKQQKSKHNIPLLPEEIEERKRRREEEHMLAEAKKSMSAEPEEKTPKSKKSKKEKSVPLTPYQVNAVATGCEIEMSRSDTQILQQLGITISKELKPGVNTIIAPKLMRTEKFLTGLSYGLDHIISPEFPKAVLREFKAHPGDQASLPKIQDFSIDKFDKKSVKALTSLSLGKLVDKSREVKSAQGLLHGLVLNITPKIPGGTTTAQKILKAHGAKDVKVLKTIKELKSLKNLKVSQDGSIWMISSENGFIEKLRELSKGSEVTTKVVDWDWVVTSIFHMEKQ